ncbi:MAG: UDP binding domain-containing protein, partial [Chitinophagales bacterium]
ALIKLGAKVQAFDPEAMENVRKIYGDTIQFGNNAYAVLKDADALIIVTEWSVFRSPDFAMMHSLMQQPIIFDGRNVFDLHEMEAQNFYYESIGRKIIG